MRPIIATVMILMAAILGCSSDQRKDPESPPNLRVAADPPQPEDPNPILPKNLEPQKEPQTSRPRAVFMGTEALGQRFCIIADASSSMNGAPVNQLKKEILQTLYDLKPGSQFYVVFFNSTAVPMPAPSWLEADKENVDKMKPWIQKIAARGGTQPSPAVDHAFKLQPRPDAIFFMTDGMIGADVVGQFSRLNAAEPRVAVHTIMFARGKIALKASEKLRIIAEKNGGTYRQVRQK